jgi:hypothetical protein
VCAVASVVCLAAASGGSARPAAGVQGVSVAVLYGPSCRKQYGTSICGTTRQAGVKVVVESYPARKRLGSGVTGRFGGVDFGPLPYHLNFTFNGRVHGHAYSGAWQLRNLQPLGGQIVPVSVLLCPSGAWVVTLVDVAMSCAARGREVLAHGAPPRTA